VLLKPAVPSALAGMLAGGECDVALLPVVDYWRNRERLQRVSDACIASDGETMTVRVFAKRPAERISQLYVDGDSHTSVVLSKIIWREVFGRHISVTPWNPQNPGSLDDVEALLLIGDKVVTSAPPGYGFQVDLGGAWKYLTGLPFVFAAWFGPAGRDFGDLATALSAMRDRGQAEAETIARRHAAAHGWPEAMAVRYLRDTLKFKITDAMQSSMERFFRSAEQYGFLP
jgi:chorismate dehydratase